MHGNIVKIVGPGTHYAEVGNTRLAEWVAGEPDVIVELRVEPFVGLSVVPVGTENLPFAEFLNCSNCTQYVARTQGGTIQGVRGTATFQLQGVEPGLYTCTLSVKQITPSGATQGPEVTWPSPQDRTFQVEVMP